MSGTKLSTVSTCDLRAQITDIRGGAATVPSPKPFNATGGSQVKEHKKIHVASATLLVVHETFLT
jgi:hypothetical protein